MSEYEWKQHETEDGYIFYTREDGYFTSPVAAKADLKPGTPGPKDAKAPMHALRLDKLQGLARVLEYGNLKYKRDNWVGTANEPDRYVGAALRHLSAIIAGEFIDPESGLPHVNHLQASVLILEEALVNSGAYEWSPENS